MTGDGYLLGHTLFVALAAALALLGGNCVERILEASFWEAGIRTQKA